jgi:hypothetical protein
MAINQSQRAGFPAELSAVMITSTWVEIGTLLENPVQIIFDNQGISSVAISIDGGTTTWRTFPAGEALVLDMRGNHGIAANFTMDLGTTFYGEGVTGTTFSISYIYALNT